MCEITCANCTKFIVDKRGIPEGMKDLSRNVFFNEDGSQKEITNPLTPFFGLQTSGMVDYGHRSCEELPSAAIASTPCIHPDSFEEKKK